MPDVLVDAATIKSVSSYSGLFGNFTVLHFSIAEVDLSKAIINVMGARSSETNIHKVSFKAVFLNSTTIRLERHTLSTSDLYYSLEVIEFAAPKSVQHLSYAWSGFGTIANLAHSEVDTSKSIIFIQQRVYQSNNSYNSPQRVTVLKESPTSIQLWRGSGSSSFTIETHLSLVEF